MQITHDIFDERIAEIELYYSALDELYALSTNTDYEEKYLDTNFLKILKSNALLMIYNLVESTIMGGILEIYEVFRQQGITYKMVRKEIQDIWFSFKFNQVYDKSAHYHSYQDKASEIITSILSDTALELDKKATNISGNLDAARIRFICENHGIQINPDKSCRGGTVLSDVKNKRNDLAHGTLSFVECGRDFSMEDLTKIKDETKLFLEAIISGMQEYYDNKSYLAASV